MKQLLVFPILLVWTLPVHAHFIWLLPKDSRNTESILMVFNDQPEPDDRVPITKIAQTKLFARWGKGEKVPLKLTQEKNAFRVPVPEEGLVMIAGRCRYGVVDKGKGEPFLLIYYPKTVQKKGIVKERTEWLNKPTEGLALEILPADKEEMLQVLWQGKPAGNVEVVFLVPGLKEPVVKKTDADGHCQAPPPKAGGIYAARALYVEKKAGQLDGKKYREIRHYATATFYFPERFLKRDK